MDQAKRQANRQPGRQTENSAQTEPSAGARSGKAVRVFTWSLRLLFGGAVVSGLAMRLLPLVWATDPSSDSRGRALAGFAVLCCEVFAFHAGLALLAASLLAAFLRRRVCAALLVSVGLALAGPGLLAWATPPRAHDPGSAIGAHADAPTLTVLSQNLLYSRASLDALAEIVEAERPDVIMLQEVVTDRADEILERFGDAYPHVVHPATHRWGGMLLSRHPFVEKPGLLVGDPEWRIDQPIGVIAFDGAPCALMSVHLPAPNRVGQLVAGPRMTARLADWVETQATDGRAAVLAGDFNAPLWTERMSSLRTAGVRSAHAESGGGRGATWPSKSPLRYAPGIRLDHAGFVGGLACVESRVLGATGSDHRPILARFVRTP